LIYYPEEKLQLVKAREKDLDDWYLITLNQLVKVCQNVSSKYTRSKVRKSLPAEFSYIIQELLHESSIEPNKHAYINVIISTIITTKRADDFIIAMCNLIQRLTIDSLHIVGDIYDRGPGAHIIMDTLCNYHNFDIQWGNHDILWMGAASGKDRRNRNVYSLSYFRQRQGAGRSGRRGESSQRTKYFYRRCKFPGRPRNGEKYQRKMPTGKSTLEKATIL
jgi:fructose-1,6-bisphosphatase-3